MCLRLQNAYLKTGIKVANCQMRKSLAQLTESPLLEKNLKNVTATCQPLLVYQRCMLSTHTGAASVIKSPYPDVVVPKVNLTHYVMNSFKGFLGNTCLVSICTVVLMENIELTTTAPRYHCLATTTHYTGVINIRRH